MCFTQSISILFSVGGCIMSGILYFKNIKTTSYCIFYFTLMEILQSFQYIYIADSPTSIQCNKINKILTSIGFLHICFQPYFNNLIHEAGIKSEKNMILFKQRFVVIKRLCLIGGSLLFFRHLYALYDDTSYVHSDTLSTEWVKHDSLCTYKGNYHLAWALPVMDVSYYVPSMNIHFFLMFMPLLTFYENKTMLISSIFLYITGPLLASFITSNLMEQASIWCFFSIAQCSIAFFKCIFDHRRQTQHEKIC